MEINKKTRNQLRLQSFSFFVLVIVIAGLIFQLSREYNTEFDWTAGSRHTVSKATAKVLEKLDSELKITSYATSGELSNVRQSITGIIKRYQKESDKISIEFIDPRLNPQKTTELGISVDGEMILEYKGRTEHLKDLSEKSITNSIYRLLRNTNRQILFLTGHGERNPLGQANHDLSIFVDNLSNKGFKVAPLDLGKTLSVPANTSVLVIASPLVDYLPGEAKIIKDYVEAGGNLLWFIEPDKTEFLKDLAAYLHLTVVKGLIIDLDNGLLGNDPTHVLGQYVQHAITENFSTTQTLFPQVTGISIDAKQKNWSIEPFVQSMPRSWLETGKMEGSVKYNEASDISGPLPFGVAMTRTVGSDSSNGSDNNKSEGSQEDKKDTQHQQRIVIMGDGDFLSNTYLGLVGNLAMGESIFNWLSHDDNFIDIPPTTATGSKIAITEMQMGFLGLIFIVLLPALFVGSGFFIWIRRRKK